MGKVAKAIRGVWPDAIVMLQGIPKSTDGKIVQHFELHIRSPGKEVKGGDCGFLIPRRLTPLIREIKHNDYWSGMLLGSTILLLTIKINV